MIKPLWVNREGTINQGALNGCTGKVVAFDSEIDKGTIQLDEQTFVSVSSELIDQEN